MEVLKITVTEENINLLVQKTTDVEEQPLKMVSIKRWAIASGILLQQNMVMPLTRQAI